jgi:hypothetical protein
MNDSPSLRIRQLTLDDASRFAMKNTRRFDHMTSIRAARDVAMRVSRHRTIALRLHAANPAGLTDFELAELSGIQQTSCGKRRLDLQRAGLIELTELTRPAPSGSQAKVWLAQPTERITAKGLETAQKLETEATHG